MTRSGAEGKRLYNKVNVELKKFQETVLGFFRFLDKRFKILLASIGLQIWASSLPAQYNQIYATLLGAKPLDLGSLEGIGGVASTVFSVPAGWLIDKLGIKRMLIFGIASMVIVAGMYGCAASWLMLIPAIILARISMWFIMPLADIIIVDTTGSERRALAVSISRALWAIPSLFAPYAAAIIISLLGGISSEGIRPLYFIQMVASLIAMLLVLVKLEDLPHRRLTSQSNSLKFDLIQSYRELVKNERWLKHWMIIMAAARLWYISMPYIPLWIVYVKGGDQNLLGLTGTLATLTVILLQVPMGRLADKIGRKKTFLILRPFVYAGTLLLAWAPNHAAIVIAGVLGMTALAVAGMGGIGSISFVPFIVLFFESFSPERRGRVQGMIGLLEVFGSLAALLGGLLWSLGYREIVLLSPILIDVLVLIPILMRIPENPNRR